MTAEMLSQRLCEVAAERLPVPAGGATRKRFTRLWEIGREDISLAKLAEAHWDAAAILEEANRKQQEDAVYAVWASESPQQLLQIDRRAGRSLLNGTKSFCSGIGLVDRSLITINGQLVDLDLREHTDRYCTELSGWTTDAFRYTHTGSIHFKDYPLREEDYVCEPHWYVDRPGFWHGACNPPACWAGGAEGLAAFAEESQRDDAHTRAHLGAMRSAVWAMRILLSAAADEMDQTAQSVDTAKVRALRVRHLVEQLCTDILRRLPRAYGPYPLVTDESISRRYRELDLYLRQTHGERDLELLGRQ